MKIYRESLSQREGIGGLGLDVLFGDEGNDYIDSRDQSPADFNDGGTGIDERYFDQDDEVENCPDHEEALLKRKPPDLSLVDFGPSDVGAENARDAQWLGGRPCRGSG